jgi:3'-phosphoadenosine 5'-phosphosulfate sulfotransferase (PAPS reductase)/FAD synthetase
MTTSKSLGIYMDHLSAHLMEFTPDPIETSTINSKFSHLEKEETLKKSENLMHNKEQHEEGAYYKHLGEVIRNYKHVILFGHSKAKDELYNILKADHHFAGTKIEVMHVDKLTENQQHAFVRDHFLNSI